MTRDSLHQTWKPRLHSAAEDIAHAAAMIARGWVTVAELSGQVRGFLAQDRDWVNALYIHPDAQRQGLGRALVTHAMTRAPKLQLWTFQANAGARAFYQRLGFCEAERTNGATTEEQLPDMRLVWHAHAKV